MAFTLTVGYTWTSGEVDTATKRNSAALPTLADGQIYGFGLGAAAAPSMSFTGDANTGIYSSGADQVSIAAGGTQIVAVTTSGVAVTGTLSASGTSSLARIDQSNGTVTFSSLGNGSTSWQIGTSSAHPLEFLQGGTVRATLSTSRFSVAELAASGAFGCNGSTPVGKQVSGGNIAGVIAGLVAIGLFSS